MLGAGSIPALLGSAKHAAISDDSAKDIDALAWLQREPPHVQDVWSKRLKWIRFADRLAENQLIEPKARRFSTFVDVWHQHVWDGFAVPGPFGAEAANISATWTTSEERTTWSFYLNALSLYHKPGLSIGTVEKHDAMCRSLTGPIFALFPYVPRELREAAADMGALDQFFNNLRDMQEDAAHGICYLPKELLREHRVTRAQVLDGSAIVSPEWVPLMTWWVECHGYELFEKASPFFLAEGLHPSLRTMIGWSLMRYARVARLMRAEGYDYRRVPARYWAESRRELAGMGYRIGMAT